MRAPGIKRSRRSRSSLAYTAVEVMLAMTVLFISSAGVISMQKAAIQGNLDARKLDVANSIARIWLDRLATDATVWNVQTGLTQTLWLNTLLNNGFQTPLPQPAASPIYSPMFDILGRDIQAQDPTVVFCTHVNVTLDALNPPTLNAMGAVVAGGPGLLRVTVLVYWAKNLLGGGAPSTNLCAVSDVAGAEAAAPGTYHMIYATEALRMNN
jgi:hypothetical protein